MVSPNGLPIVCCTRPGKWGNPFKVVKCRDGFAVHTDSNIENAHIVVNNCNYRYINKIDALKAAVKCYKAKLFPCSFENNTLKDFKLTESILDEIAAQLGDKNLACWCAIGSPCHVQDVLLPIIQSRS